VNGNGIPGPVVLHRIRGRIRVHLPFWEGGGGRALEARIRQISGVRRVEANSITRNVLVHFDPRATAEATLLSILAGAGKAATRLPEDEPAPQVLTEKQEGTLRRARIPVRGLDRDPGVARRVVEVLGKRLGVRAWANPLTAHVVVEYDEKHIDLREVLAKVVEVELPADVLADLLGGGRGVGVDAGAGEQLLDAADNSRNTRDPCL